MVLPSLRRLPPPNFLHTQRKEHSDLLPTPRHSFLAHPHGAWVSASCGGNAFTCCALKKAGGNQTKGKTLGRQNSDTRHLLSSPNVPMITFDDLNVPLVTFEVKRAMYFMLPLGM
jgi:hypothetical protein